MPDEMVSTVCSPRNFLSHRTVWAPHPVAADAVGVDGVTPYRISHPGPGGLIFGFAAVSEQAIAEGVGILARVIGEV